MPHAENAEVVTPDVNQLAQETPEAEPVQTAPQDEVTEHQPEENQPPAEKTFTQKELDEILEKRTAKLARQRDAERTKRETYERELSKVAPSKSDGRPTLEQCDNDPDKYAEAVSDWKIKQREQASSIEQSKKSQLEFAAKRDDLMADLEETEGFSARKFGKLPISEAMAEAIVDSDVGVKLALHLQNNPDDVSRIAALPAARQAAEIGKLEVKLSAPPAAKKPSNAPAPITPVGSKGNVVTADLYDPKFAKNADAWIAERNRQEAARRK